MNSVRALLVMNLLFGSMTMACGSSKDTDALPMTASGSGAAAAVNTAGASPSPAPIAGRSSVTAAGAAAAAGGGGVAGVGASGSGQAGGPSALAGAGAAGSISAAGSGGAVAGGPSAGRGGVGGGAGAPAAGSGGNAGMPSPAAEDECGPIPAGQPPMAAMAKAVVQNGLVEYHTKAPNEFIGLRTTLYVPAKPTPTGIFFVFPAMQPYPSDPDPGPLGPGILQPVLTWGQPSCVPGALSGYSSWFISPAYVNEDSTERSRRGCFGGPVIAVDVEDPLELEMRLEGTRWSQKVVDLKSKKMTEFTIDLSGQPQQRALFWIEIKNTGKPVSDLIFEKTVLTMKTPEPGACDLNNRGMRDYASKARVSADGRHCCIDRIVLRAAGVPATTMDP